MPSLCVNCGAELGFGRRVTGKTLCSTCESQQRANQAAARQEFELLLTRVPSEPDPLILRDAIASARGRTGLSPLQLRDKAVDVVRQALQRAMDDEYLTEEEEARVIRVASAVDATDPAIVFAGIEDRVQLARINAGRLPVIDTTEIVMKRGERAHLQVPADLMKEVVLREYRAGYSGFSFRIAKGVRFHTGGVRGRSVVVGTELQVSDSGVLVITSQRAVFKGLRRAIESNYAKLVGLNVFVDGIQIHVSNRQTAPLFRVPNGFLVAAAVNAASQAVL